MKFLKGLLLVLVILVAIVVIIGLIAPNEYRVERTATIDALPGVIHSEITDLNNWESWSPWADMDTNQVVTVTGEPSTAGAKYHWKGDVTGEGEIVATSVDENGMEYDMNWIAPMEGQSKGSITMAEAEEGMDVTWEFHGEMGMPWNIVGLFSSMDSQVGPDFAEGLEMLKAKCEGKEIYTPETVDLEGFSYLGKEMSVNMNDISSEHYAMGYGAVGMFMGVNEIQGAGMPICLVKEHNEDSGDMTLIMAIPVAGDIPEDLGDLVAGEVPAGKALQAVHMGAYHNIDQTWNNLHAYSLAARKEASGMPFERFVTDPGTEPDTSKWVTHIVWPI